MQAKAYCGHFVGPPYWHGTEIYEPDECCWQGMVDVDKQEWEEGCISIGCPNCGAILCQGDEHFELERGE